MLRATTTDSRMRQGKCAFERAPWGSPSTAEPKRRGGVERAPRPAATRPQKGGGWREPGSSHQATYDPVAAFHLPAAASPSTHRPKCCSQRWRHFLSSPTHSSRIRTLGFRFGTFRVCDEDGVEAADLPMPCRDVGHRRHAMIFVGWEDNHVAFLEAVPHGRFGSVW